MAQLRQDYPRFEERDCTVLVVDPEDAAAFKAYWETGPIPFVGLPDPGHTVLRRYGQEVRLFKLGRMPAQMLIDKSGILRLVHYGRSMAHIPSTADILEFLTG